MAIIVSDRDFCVEILNGKIYFTDNKTGEETTYISYGLFERDMYNGGYASSLFTYFDEIQKACEEDNIM